MAKETKIFRACLNNNCHKYGIAKYTLNLDKYCPECAQELTHVCIKCKTSPVENDFHKYCDKCYKEKQHAKEKRKETAKKIPSAIIQVGPAIVGLAYNATKGSNPVIPNAKLKDVASKAHKIVK